MMQEVLSVPQNSKTTMLLLTGLFTAFTAIGAALSIPLPFTAVPVTLATLIAMLAGTLLGPKYGSISQVVYIFTGIIGIPVFHNFTAGLGIVFGPTGGYLLGYIAIAFCAGLAASKPSSVRLVIMLILGNLLCYIFGTVWFLISSGSLDGISAASTPDGALGGAIGAALISCVVPFIPGDILKIAAAVILTGRLKHLRK